MAVTAGIRESSASAVRAALTGGKRDVRGMLFAAALLLCLLLSMLMLTVLLWDVVAQAIPVFQKRSTGFLMNDLASNPDKAGVSQGIWGSLMIAGFVVLLAFPVGIAAGVYLEEYAPDTRLTRLIALNIRNLAGVPSIVFGVFGLGFFVYVLGGTLDQLFFSDQLKYNNNTPVLGTGGLLWCSLTLALMTLPVVIVATEEALSAVPNSMRSSTSHAPSPTSTAPA